MSAPVVAVDDSMAGERRMLVSASMLALALVSLLGIHWQTVISMTGTWWRSDTYAHGLVIVPIMLYMVWERRDRLYQATIRPAAGAVLILALLTAGWLVGRSASVIVVQQFAVTAMIPALVYLVFGADVVRRMTFPLFYLLFMVPFGESLVPFLQDITAVITVSGLQASGIPVLQEGRYLTIPSGKFEVAAACSGIRYLIASVAVGSCYAYLCYTGFWRRWAFVLLAVLVPIVANGIRAYGIVMIAHLSEMRMALGVDHFFYGWVFFGLVMFLLFWVGSYWHDEPDDTGYQPSTGLALRYTGTFTRTLTITLAGLAVMLAGPVFWDTSERTLAQENPAPFSLEMHAGGDWIVLQEVDSTWQPEFHGATEQAIKAYSNGESVVLLYYAWYAKEGQGRELINSMNRIYDGRHWRRSDDALMHLESRGQEMQVQETLLRNRDSQLLVWHWYDIEGRLTENRWYAKLLAVQDRLFGRHSRGSAVFAVATPVLEAQDARRVLKAFLGTHRPALQ